jgi:hypothetical protein
MRTEEARRLRPGARVLCPAERDDPPRSVVVVSVATELQEDLFGHPFVWVTVRDPQRGGLAVHPSNLLGAAPRPAPQDQGEGQGDLFADRSAVT